MIMNGVEAMTRKEGVFQVTLLRSPPAPAKCQTKPQEDSNLELLKVQLYSLNHTAVLDRWFVNQQ